MSRFRQDNTEGYENGELAQMNWAFDRIVEEEGSGIDDLVRKSFEDHIAECVQVAFDHGCRDSQLITRARDLREAA